MDSTAVNHSRLLSWIPGANQLHPKIIFRSYLWKLKNRWFIDQRTSLVKFIKQNRNFIKRSLISWTHFKLEDASKYCFYWKSGNRIDIEATLRTHSDGTFLVRLARDRSLCLSVKADKVYHLKLVEEGIGKLKRPYRFLLPDILPDRWTFFLW